MAKQLPAVIPEEKIEIHLRTSCSCDIINKFGPGAYLTAILFPELIDWDKVKEDCRY